MLLRSSKKKNVYLYTSQKEKRTRYNFCKIASWNEWENVHKSCINNRRIWETLYKKSYGINQEWKICEKTIIKTFRLRNSENFCYLYYFVHFGTQIIGLLSSGIVRRCPWCNGYRRRKWTRWLEFRSWTILIGKVWIQLCSLQLWVNSRTDRVLQPWWGN